MRTYFFIVSLVSLLACAPLYCMEPAEHTRVAELKALAQDSQYADIVEMLSNTCPKKIAKILTKYPIILNILKEAQVADAHKSFKVKILDYVTGIPSHVAHEYKGIALGATLTCLGIMTYNALQPEQLCQIAPQGTYYALMGACALLAVPKIFSKIKLPTNTAELVTLKLINLSARLLPWVPVVNKALQKNELPLNHAITQESVEYYKKLLNSLTHKQRQLMANPTISLRLLIDPKVLIGELDFLSSLDEDQMYFAYQFLELSQVSVHPKFEEIKCSLTRDQQAIIMPRNRLLIAQYNPLVLLNDDNFIATVNAEQEALFQSL